MITNDVISFEQPGSVYCILTKKSRSNSSLCCPCKVKASEEHYHISSVIGWSFFLLKQFQKPRSVSKDRSRSFGFFLKGKTSIIAKFHRTD